jgi:hypothetical protein
MNVRLLIWRRIKMTFDKALAIMKKGGTVFKKQNPDILYTAKFDDVTKKYTLFENEKDLGNDADWDLIMLASDWEIISNDV